MNWSFGIVNNKLAEIYFEKKKKNVTFIGHCYVMESEYKTKKEKKWIQEDREKVKLVYRNGKYIKK